MDEEDFEESQHTLHHDDVEQAHPRHPLESGASPHPERSPRQVSPTIPHHDTPEKRPRPGIEWVRTSDLLSTGTGRIAGRGIDLGAELARRTRRAPAVAYRAVHPRADRLPPLSKFGQSRERPQITRPGLTRD